MDGQACENHFHVLLAWELDHQLYDLHHLVVLCYHLQHPHLYSPEALRGAVNILVDVIENNVHPHEIRNRIRQAVASDKRAHKVKGTSAKHGTYAHPIDWNMRVTDVKQAGIDNFYASVRRWAATVLSALRELGNLA